MPNTDTQSESKREGVADTATERVKILGGVPALVNLSERLAASPSEVTSPAPEQSAPPAKPEFPSEDPAQQAKTEGVADNAAESKAPRNFPWRVVKILSATVLLAIGLYAMAVPHLVVTTDNAVVSAYLASVRVPIEGTLSGPALSPGSRIEKGSAIAHIENSRTTDDRLQDLTTIRFNCTGSARAIEEQISALSGQKQALLARLSAGRDAVLRRLDNELREAELAAEAKGTAVEMAESDLNRARTLRRVGVITQADLDRRIFESQLASKEEDEAKAKFATLQSEKDAAARGLMSERGETADVPYSAQRIDEITLHIAELRRLEATSLLQAQSLAAYEAQAASHAGLMRQAELVAPETGSIWKSTPLPANTSAPVIQWPI